MGLDYSDIFVDLTSGTTGQRDWCLQLETQSDSRFGLVRYIISPSIGRIEVSEVTSFLFLNQLLKNADILGLKDLHSEDLAFWVFIEKQAVECECRHRRKLEEVRKRVTRPHIISCLCRYLLLIINLTTTTRNPSLDVPFSRGSRKSSEDTTSSGKITLVLREPLIDGALPLTSVKHTNP